MLVPYLVHAAIHHLLESANYADIRHGDVNIQFYLVYAALFISGVKLVTEKHSSTLDI
ncbi:hypothetical protein DPMN_179679 [Dreissena polymorpha]|uniref:Uncharacterized protein n=1 Tax=Dreissena polymorpha TaxID=45954 RepID=A0A9D4ECS2_DREPO|nr:hypothetical protein DPMN_179679 [Dreissena polymorpha]